MNRYMIEDRPTDLESMNAGYDIWDEQEQRRIAILPDGHGQHNPMYKIAQDIRNAMEFLNAIRQLSRLQTESPPHDVQKQKDHIQELLRAGNKASHETRWIFSQAEVNTLAEIAKDLEDTEEEI